MKKLLVSVAFLPLLLFYPGNSLMSRADNEQQSSHAHRVFDLENELICSWSKNYETVIEFIKQHEGFRSKIYHCPAGSLTIGYGHIIRKGDKFPAKGITKQTADSLLRADFGRAIKMTEHFTNLKGSRKLAVCHFIYSKGSGAFCHSNLRRQIRKNGNVDNEFIKWCYYTDPKTGQKIKSNVAQKITYWEREMYHKDDNLYATANK